MRTPEEQARVDAIRDAVMTRLRAKWAKREAQKKARAAALHQKTKNKPKRRAQLRASTSRYQKRHPDKVAKRDRRARNRRGLRSGGRRFHRHARQKISTQRRDPAVASTHIKGCAVSIVTLDQLRSSRFIRAVVTKRAG